MKDMAYTSAELEEQKKEYGPNPDVGNMPKYPWGLEIRLSDEVLKKLGVTLPDVGGKVRLVCDCEVTSKSARKEADGDTKASTELQIVAMEVGEAEQKPQEQSAVMFGK